MSKSPVLVFDFGGVIVDLDKQRCIDAFSRLGFDVSPLIGTFVQSGILTELERGLTSVSAFCAEVRRLCGKPVHDADIISAWQAYLTGVPEERLALLRRIHAHYPTYVLSNTNEIHWAMATDDYFARNGSTFADYFDGAFLSYELHCEKPEAEIFQRVAEGIGRAPEEIIFLDDSEANCAAARRCGMRALLAEAGSKWFRYFTPDGVLTV